MRYERRAAIQVKRTRAWNISVNIDIKRSKDTAVHKDQSIT